MSSPKTNIAEALKFVYPKLTIWKARELCRRTKDEAVANFAARLVAEESMSVDRAFEVFEKGRS